MVRQAHPERNQYLIVRPKPVEGFNQSFPNTVQAPQVLQQLQDPTENK